MKTKYLLGLLALTMSSAAFAADPAPAPAPEKECCCCKKDEHAKMACCKDQAGQTGADHAGHGEGGSGRH